LKETNHKIFNESSKDDYLRLLHNLNLDLDIYYNPSFLLIDAKIQKGEYEIFCLIKTPDIFIYPYIKLKFNNTRFKSYFDITSPYGYCGPYSTSASILKNGEDELIKYLKNNCVTEFIRYHYLYNDKKKFKINVENSQNRSIVTLNLKLDLNTIWFEQFSSKNRNLIRKLENEKYSFTTTRNKEDLQCFIQMYFSTMKNVGANQFYFFKKSILENMFKLLENKICLVKVEKKNIVYGYAMFLLSGGIATYYLSARNINFPKIPATNYLLYKSAKLFKEKGVELLNFGGGLSNETNDSLFKFKKNFSKETKEFYIGKRIHNFKVYNEVSKKWIYINGLEEYEKKSKMLQFYR
jgi:hypothetical protein